jgi:hypothetical protein
MASLARVVKSVSLSLVVGFVLWGCGSSTTSNSPDAATGSTKTDSAPGTSSDLPTGTSYDTPPLADGPANADGPSNIADAFVPNDVAGKDVGIGTSTDLPVDTSLDSSSGPDKPAPSDVPTDRSADIAFPADGPTVIPLDAPAVGDLAGGSVDTASGPDVATCGGLSQACCAGKTCDSNLVCLNGASCSCAKALYGRYLLRSDGALLYETDPTSTAQTPVLDATTATPLADVVDAMEGPSHGCAVLGSAQTAWCWRAATTGNNVGQLGNGTTDTSGPLWRATQVLTAANQPLTKVVALSYNTSSSGSNSACAVTSTGELYCWGTLTYVSNNGTTLDAPYATPITTDGVTHITGVLQVSLANTYACALLQGTSSREVWCWGTNELGNLATGDTTFREYPTKVLGLTDPSYVLAYGYPGNTYYNNGTTCVIDGGNVRCWGSNNVGQVGNGTTNSPVLSPTIVTLMGGSIALSGIVDIKSGGHPPNGGYQDICTLGTNNSVVCWGSPFHDYPSSYPASDIAAIGSLDDSAVRFLTTDGLYHYAPTNGSAATVHAPNCGLLQ